jgi:hypothetical protein
MQKTAAVQRRCPSLEKAPGISPRSPKHIQKKTG